MGLLGGVLAPETRECTWDTRNPLPALSLGLPIRWANSLAGNHGGHEGVVKNTNLYSNGETYVSHREDIFLDSQVGNGLSPRGDLVTFPPSSSYPTYQDLRPLSYSGKAFLDPSAPGLCL